MKALIVCLALLVGGCAASLQEPGASLATQYAVMKWIDKGDDPVIRAHRVLDIAEALKADPAMVPLDGLKQAVFERVQGFDPSDQMLAVALVDVLTPYLDTREAAPVALSELAILLRRAAWYYL